MKEIKKTNVSAAIAEEFKENAIYSRVDECEVRLEDEYPALEYTLSINGVRTAPKGNIIAITGQAKEGKSKAMELVTKVILEGSKNAKNQSTFRLQGEIDDACVLYFDTEMDIRDTQSWVKRTQKSCNWSEEKTHPRIHAYNLREYSPEIRMQIIETQVSIHNPDAIIVDGARDLVSDFNNIQEVSKVTNWLLSLIHKFGTTVFCVIHKNKNDNFMRGHLGSELLNKCYACLSVKKQVDKGKNIFTLKEEVTRGKSFGEVHFTLDEEGIPTPLDANYTLPKKDVAKRKSKKEQSLTNDPKILQEIYAESTSISLSNGQIRDAWMEKTGKSSSSFGRVFAKYRDANYLVQTEDKRYSLNI